MSTDRIKGEVVFICDDCDDHLETEESDFEAANKARQEAGWIARPIRGVWHNYCTVCKADHQ